MEPAQMASVTLINNAGTLGAMAPLPTIASETITQAITVDLIAPLQLMASFLQATSAWQSGVNVLNISSGISQRAMAMPQVHIVAYCTDLGFGAARGAEMLSLM
jgi:short-subunit dehydrogenase involved in D-alanine esterification of teichoic acids